MCNIVWNSGNYKLGGALALDPSVRGPEDQDSCEEIDMGAYDLYIDAGNLPSFEFRLRYAAEDSGFDYAPTPPGVEGRRIGVRHIGVDTHDLVFKQREWGLVVFLYDTFPFVRAELADDLKPLFYRNVPLRDFFLELGPRWKTFPSGPYDDRGSSFVTLPVSAPRAHKPLAFMTNWHM